MCTNTLLNFLPVITEYIEVIANMEISKCVAGDGSAEISSLIPVTMTFQQPNNRRNSGTLSKTSIFLYCAYISTCLVSVEGI